MHCLADDPTVFGYENINGDEGSESGYSYSIPIPVLLHLCTETHILTLTHYELTFGNANALVCRPRIYIIAGSGDIS